MRWLCSTNRTFVPWDIFTACSVCCLLKLAVVQWFSSLWVQCDVNRTSERHVGEQVYFLATSFFILKDICLRIGLCYPDDSFCVVFDGIIASLSCASIVISMWTWNKLPPSVYALWVAQSNCYGMLLCYELVNGKAIESSCARSQWPVLWFQ